MLICIFLPFLKTNLKISPRFQALRLKTSYYWFPFSLHFNYYDCYRLVIVPSFLPCIHITSGAMCDLFSIPQQWSFHQKGSGGASATDSLFNSALWVALRVRELLSRFESSSQLNLRRRLKSAAGLPLSSWRESSHSPWQWPRWSPPLWQSCSERGATWETLGWTWRRESSPFTIRSLGALKQWLPTP